MPICIIVPFFMASARWQNHAGEVYVHDGERQALTIATIHAAKLRAHTSGASKAALEDTASCPHEVCAAAIIVLVQNGPTENSLGLADLLDAQAAPALRMA